MNWIVLRDHVWEVIFYLFCFAAFIQVFYYSFFYSRVAFYEQKERTQSQQHPVSVIICAKDEDENIARFLPGILVQKYPSTHEVIVVNDNSVDDSKYILGELQKTFKLLRIVDLKQEAKLISGKKYPLSIGIKEAKHEIILLTDADCVPASEFWIQKMQDASVNGTEIVIGYGAYNKRPGLLNKIIRFETFHSALQYLSFALAGTPYMGVGRNLSYKKDVFLRNKGFSSINHIPGGDDDLFINKVANKHNTAVVIDKDEYARFAGNMNLVDTLKKQVGEKSKLIDGYIKDRSKLVSKGSEERVKWLGALASAANKVRSYLRFFAAKEQSLLLVQDEVRNLRAYGAPEELRKMSERHRATRLNLRTGSRFSSTIPATLMRRLLDILGMHAKKRKTGEERL